MERRAGRVWPWRSDEADAGARWLTGAYAASTLIAALSWLFGRWGQHSFHWLEELVTLVNIPLSRTMASVALLALITVALVLRKRVALIAVMVCQLFGMYPSG